MHLYPTGLVFSTVASAECSNSSKEVDHHDIPKPSMLVNGFGEPASSAPIGETPGAVGVVRFEGCLGSTSVEPNGIRRGG